MFDTCDEEKHPDQSPIHIETEYATLTSFPTPLKLDVEDTELTAVIVTNTGHTGNFV